MLIRFLYTADYDASPLQSPTSRSTTLEKPTCDQPLFHTRVYVLAEKYDIPALKALASKKFKATLPSNGLSVEFVASLELIFKETPENDRLLRNIALDFVGKKYRELVNKGDLVELCKRNGDAAGEVIKAIAAAPLVPFVKTCPRCKLDDDVKIQSRMDKTFNQKLYMCYKCNIVFS